MSEEFPVMNEAQQKQMRAATKKGATRKFGILADGTVVRPKEYVVGRQTRYIIASLSGCPCPAHHPDGTLLLVTGVEGFTVFGPVSFDAPGLEAFCPGTWTFQEAFTEKEAVDFGVVAKVPGFTREPANKPVEKPANKPILLDDTVAFEKQKEADR